MKVATALSTGYDRTMPQAVQTLEPSLMSVTEFLEWAPAHEGSWQLVDGLPQAMNPGSRTHGTIQAEMARCLGSHAETMESGCVVLIEPGITPRLSSNDNYRVSDLAVTCKPYSQETWTVDEPILIVEVLSGSNRSQTWNNIWAFTTIPSVRDILVLHTDCIRASILTRHTDGTWPLAPTVVEGDAILHLRSLAFETGLAGLYRNTRLVLG